MRTGSGTVLAKGFKANYTLECGSRIVTNDSGEIALKKDITMGQNCTWIIIADDPSKRVTLTITYLNIFAFDDEESECVAHLVVRDGETEDAPIKYQNCGGKPPPAIVSRGNALRVSVNIPDTVLTTFENLMPLGEFDAHYTILDNGIFLKFKF